MGFNSKHHDEEKATEAVVHVHEDGKQHVHHKGKEIHSHNKAQKHDEASNHDEPATDNGSCCTDKVKEFQQVTKYVHKIVTIVRPVFFTAFPAPYYNINVLPHTDIVRDIKSFVRSYHPPIPDIRIAVQSFQI